LLTLMATNGAQSDALQERWAASSSELARGHG
jgi:hypothetical protein